VNCPLHEGTHDLINEKTAQWFKPGAWLVNTARGAICNAEAVKKAVESGQLNGYAGDVWNVQPAPKDHPWRTMKNPLGGGNGMYVEVVFLPQFFPVQKAIFTHSYGLGFPTSLGHHLMRRHATRRG